MSQSPHGGTALFREIASSIRAAGPIPFDRFMDQALHHPSLGYYARGPERLGPGGDFITSPEISAAFGECLASQIAEMDRLLGREPFTLVELGAGSGRLAEDILSAFASGAAGDLPERLTLLLVERSERMRGANHRLEGHPGARRVLTAASLEEATRAVGGGIRGAVISNEFFDALPTHIVARRDGRLHELLVGLASSGDRLAPVHRLVEDADLLAYAERYRVAPEEGMEAEICLEALTQLRRIALCLERGFHLCVDYGHPADELYSGRRPRGTLLAYRRHTVSEEFLERVGEQDLTAHVNFTALIEEGREAGLDSAGLTTQDRFLISLGLAGRIAQLAGQKDAAAIRRRLSLMALIHPEGMGGTFRVLIQYKGIKRPALTGLLDPYGVRSLRAPGSERTGANVNSKRLLRRSP